MSELTLKEQGDKFLKNGLWRDAVDAYTCVLEATAEIRPEDAAILVSRRYVADTVNNSISINLYLYMVLKYVFLVGAMLLWEI